MSVDVDLAHHGDRDATPGLVDLAVNVRSAPHPPWLSAAIAGADLTRYPDDADARAALGARHGRPADEVLVTAGAAEAFVLVARVLRPTHAVMVHPQFTEPERALRAAGHDVDRVVLRAPYTLDPSLIPSDADLVVVGNPTNPTSVLHARTTLERLARPGRTLVVVRRLTKTWALPGLRAGYLLASAGSVAALSAAQPAWPVSAPALAACVATCSPAAHAEVDAWRLDLAAERAHLLGRLRGLPGVSVTAPSGPFVLARLPVARAWEALRARGFAVRRGDTFPGLSDHHVRLAVRDRITTDDFVAALAAVLR